jgi:hypothetical protein
MPGDTDIKRAEIKLSLDFHKINSPLQGILYFRLLLALFGTHLTFTT